ncbi:MAG: PilZ domain-containing protein [Spirochaetaceae bacterium]|jgi:hypothetical protein|nr:PilZ domain-containing protein [Spirochaetaceae bacterium]
MATSIKRIEKDFLLKTLFDEKTPVTYLFNREEYTLTMVKPPDRVLYFKPDRHIERLEPKQKMDLMFIYWGQMIKFSIEIVNIKEEIIIADTPEFLFKNLDRSFARVPLPGNLKVSFVFQGERYALGYPVVPTYESVELLESMKSFDPNDLRGLLQKLALWIKGIADGHRMFIFKGVKPRKLEEQIISETGKILYIPSIQTGLPPVDPYPQGKIITGEFFLNYMENKGFNPRITEETLDKLLKSKTQEGICSEIWVPIIFQQYVIGYIQVWTTKDGSPPLDYKAIETIYQFTKIIAFSLKTQGYFESRRIKNEPFEGKIIDISASGLLVAYPYSALASALRTDCELTVKLETPDRAVNTNARIIRRFTLPSDSYVYIGCRFLDMDPEDIRFIFEFIYGKPFSGTEATFLAGQV